MAHINDVAAYILDRRGPMTVMKLQKLCYYAYGYHLAWEGRRLFPERFEAWANGPVAPALYKLHRGQFELKAGDIPGDLTALTVGERDSIDLVLAAYGNLSAHQLSVMTHSEPPWQAARARAKAGPMERSTEPLLVDEVYAHFDALTAAGADDEAAEG